jgi:tetratricopeptide (TPR) repeat protein
MERQGDIAKAIDAILSAIQAGANQPACYLRLARLYESQRRWSLAVGAAEQALAFDPELVSAREAVIALALESRDYNRAISASMELLKRMPSHVPARDALGVAYMGLGDVVAAARVAADLVRLEPSEPSHRFKRAMLCQHQGDIRAAVEEFERVVDMAPESEIAQSAIDQLEALDEYQINDILLLAQEDMVFRNKILNDAGLAAAERGYTLSATGGDKLMGVAMFAFGDDEPSTRPRLYH